MIFDFILVKAIFLYLIFAVTIFYQVVIFITLYRQRKEVNFLSIIKRDGNISKSGVFFVVLMLIITYQALFLDEITAGLIELMGVIVCGDLGATWMSNNKFVSLEKIKKTRESKDIKDLDPDEFKDL